MNTIMENDVKIKRKVDFELLEWKLNSDGKTAVLISGARRVGKSFVAENFAKKHYASYILIDFSAVEDEVRDLFLYQSNDLDTFFGMLQAIRDVRLIERQSVIIFDEVQLFPKAREMVKRLVADRRYDYIETGSLLSIKKNTESILIPSEEREINMYPLDFEGFLWANGQEMLFDIAKKCFEDLKPMEESLHRRFMSLFRQYLVVGGMPQAVLEYVVTRDFAKVDAVKRDILHLYRDDIYKHGGNNSERIEQIYNTLPTQLAQANKRFMFSVISDDARYREYAEALLWLADSRTVNICYNTTEPTIGLMTRMDMAAFKCYQADTGLLVSQSFAKKILSKEEIYKKMVSGKLELNNGMILENAVAQMLKAAGTDLYYYSETENRMEIDFVTTKNRITSKHNIIPIEVKSGKKYLVRSLDKFQKKYNDQLDTAFILHDGMLSVDRENKRIYLPVYMAGLL